MRKFWLLMVATLVVVLAACDSRTPENAAAAVPRPAPAPRETTPVPPEYVASGPLVVENQVDVPAQRVGVVDKIVADVGERVRRGSLLAELDSRQLVADRDAAEAHARSLQAEWDHWKAEIKARQSDLTRDEEMFKADLITAKQVEHSRYAVEGARFEAVRESENLKNAQDALRSLELELEKTHIVAPFDGVVARRYVRVGQKVAVGDRVFWVTAMSPLEVKFTVPQEFAGKLSRGDEVLITSPAAPDRHHAARISMIAPVVDPSSGTLEVQARLTGESADLLPGMTVNIHLPKR